MTLNATPSRRRAWRLTGLLALALAAAAWTRHSSRALDMVHNARPGHAAVPRLRLLSHDGRFFRQGASAPFTGWMLDYHPSGAVKARSFVRNGLLEGESEGWHTNGLVELREYFHRGLPHGIRTTWHQNGRKRSEGRLREGQQHGVFRQWHENGGLAVEAEFEAGTAHGVSQAWHSDGRLKAKVMMNRGVVLWRHSPDGDALLQASTVAKPTL